MKSTELNVVDKFSQAVCVVELRHNRRVPARPSPSPYPALSDLLGPDFIGQSNKLNTVFQQLNVTAGQ